jgi:hypothetical protein
MYNTETGCLKYTDEDKEDNELSIKSQAINKFFQELSETLTIFLTKDKGNLFDLDLSFMLDDENPKNQYGDCFGQHASQKGQSKEPTVMRKQMLMRKGRQSKEKSKDEINRGSNRKMRVLPTGN